MRIVGNAPVVSLTLFGTKGVRKDVHLLLDTGGGAIILNQAVAAQLDLQPKGLPHADEDGQVYRQAAELSGQIAGQLLHFTSAVYIHTGSRSFDTREKVDGLLPGKALQNYDVILDYPGHQFAIAQSGCFQHQGLPVPSPALKLSGHPQIDVSLPGTQASLLLDTGSRVSLARKSLLLQLIQDHPDWRHATGASSDADMPGSRGDEVLLRVPTLQWGPFTLKDVLFASRPDSTYGIAYETPEPIVGALGGDALKHFRLEMDYPQGRTWLTQNGNAAKELNSVGLDLDINTNGYLVVVTTTSSASKRTKDSIRRGDIILRIDHKQQRYWTIIEASDALSGEPGAVKHILLRRKGRLLDVKVDVVPLL